MHELTVSRVTSNKYLHCDRGTFELKYFFTSGVGGRGWRGRGFGRGGQGRDPPADRRRGRQGDPLRRRAGRSAAGQRLRPRPADGSQIPRGDRAGQLGAEAQAEGAGGGDVDRGSNLREHCRRTKTGRANHAAIPAKRRAGRRLCAGARRLAAARRPCSARTDPRLPPADRGRNRPCSRCSTTPTSRRSRPGCAPNSPGSTSARRPTARRRSIAQSAV